MTCANVVGWIVGGKRAWRVVRSGEGPNVGSDHQLLFAVVAH